MGRQREKKHTAAVGACAQITQPLSYANRNMTGLYQLRRRALPAQIPLAPSALTISGVSKWQARPVAQRVSHSKPWPRLLLSSAMCTPACLSPSLSFLPTIRSVFPHSLSPSLVVTPNPGPHQLICFTSKETTLLTLGPWKFLNLCSPQFPHL